MHKSSAITKALPSKQKNVDSVNTMGVKYSSMSEIQCGYLESISIVTNGMDSRMLFYVWHHPMDAETRNISLENKKRKDFIGEGKVLWACVLLRLSLR